MNPTVIDQETSEDPRVTAVVKSLVLLLEKYKKLCEEGKCSEEYEMVYHNCIEALKIYNNE